MKLPLFLCVALASALAGCNDNCDLDYCGFTSQSSQSTYQAQASTPTYQAPSRQVDLSGYGGMYAHVRLPGSPSRQSNQGTQSATTQSADITQKPPGYVAPSVVAGGCTDDYAGQYFPDTNTIHMCATEKTQPPSFLRFARIHEEGHAIDFQRNGKNFSADPEYQADKYAIERLLKEGDCEAIQAKANMGKSPEVYRKGTRYAQDIYSTHC